MSSAIGPRDKDPVQSPPKEDIPQQKEQKEPDKATHIFKERVSSEAQKDDEWENERELHIQLIMKQKGCTRDVAEAALDIFPL